MPRLGRQCRTTVSPGFTLVTPGPVSITVRGGLMAEQMRQELVRPLGRRDLVDLRAADRGVEHLDQHLADTELVGQRRSRRRSAARATCARIAALAVLTFMRIDRASFEVDEFVVAGVAEVLVEPDPFRRVKELFGRQRPAFEIELLELVPIALDHDVLVLADALDFLQRRLQARTGADCGSVPSEITRSKCLSP